MQKTFRTTASTALGGLFVLVLVGCAGDMGKPGPAGEAGPPGQPAEGGADGSSTADAGAAGEVGPKGPKGESGGGVRVGNFHGTQALEDMELETFGKYFVDATITSASADEAGKVTVNFKVETIVPAGSMDKPKALAGLKTRMRFGIAKLAPKAAGVAWNSWVSYIQRLAEVKGSAKGDWPNPDGTKANQGNVEGDGALTDHGDGTYTYVFKANLKEVKTPVEGTPIAYERSLTHRLTITMGGHDLETASTTFDFVPAGGAVTETRNIVQTANCKQCHADEFHGHGGDRLTVETCTVCHNPGTVDPESGNSVDLKTMVHKIHAGSELASIPGPDGVVWDDPATPADESADNGEYAIWGNGSSKHSWWKVGFPAVIENCTKCHQGTGENVDSWKTNPSRAACGACHDKVDWGGGTNHEGGAQATDNDCVTCHKPEGKGLGMSVTDAHDWTKHDPRNISEFKAELSMSPPGNGMYYVKGEAPVVTIILKDIDTGVPIDHTTVVQGAAVGCLATGCAPWDGKFANSAFFVHGPRARRNPVLTTTARVELVGGAGPFDLSAAGLTLVVKLDGGRDLLKADAAAPIVGTVTVAVSSGAFADPAAATVSEVVAWLNKDAKFKARAIAYDAGGKIAIRSRNLGSFYSLQILAGPVNMALFGGVTAVQTVGGSTPSNQLYAFTDATKNDPKVTRLADRITYQLDPVDDLQSGTYVATVEIAGRGRKSDGEYKTPTVAKFPFQVGTATPEKPPANNCDSCHQGPQGTGFVLDYARHHKIFDHTAVDQCGSCHDYQSRDATGVWTGGLAIARRVHAVHAGSTLAYPSLTAGHADGIPGRNWDITPPQDLRRCDTMCHPADTSGTYLTKPSRMPCGGCHDKDASQAHMKIMTYDPTPLDPWNGDEEESCATCH